MSVLLIVAAFLRRKVKIFQHFYIPAALIAGALGLLMGPQVLGKFSPIYFGYSKSISQWAGVLSAIVFATSFLGIKLEKVTGSALQTYFLAGTVHQLQVIVGLSAAFLLSLAFSDLKMGFGILPVLGFYGGHSMAIAGGTIYSEAGYWADGPAVGATFATVGMLTGVIAGMAIINRAAQKGLTKVRMKRDELPPSMLTGFFPPEERQAIGNAVTSASTLDPLASQLMLVGFVILCGNYLRNGLIAIDPFWKNLPLFACSLICSGIFCMLTQKSKKITAMMDRRTLNRISGTALEYLIASSIATTSLAVFVNYAVPLIIVCVLVAVITYIGCFVIGKYVLPKNDFFETAIGLFGQTCGVLATGLMLLKVVDPDYTTNAATNITSSSTLGYSFQLQYTLLFVPLLMTNVLFVYGWSWLLLVLLLGAGLFFGKRIRAKEAKAATA
jgi:ESS family glutamate:Na+ symporter